jgi:DNA repair protein RadC
VAALADRPRERLASLGPAALSDAELVALLLRTGSGAQSAVELGAATLEAVHGLRGLASAAVGELEALPGFGLAKAATLVAAIELGRRGAARRLARGEVLRSPGDVHRHFASRLRDEACERFLVLLLDGRHRVLGEVTVSQGTLTASLVHPREVFGPAIRRSAAAIVLVHNHPSGDPTPSAEDRSVTLRLRQAGELLGIRVVDHVVIAERGYYSFDEAGDLAES